MVDIKNPKTHQWLKTTKVYFRSPGGSAPHHPHSGTPVDRKSTIWNPEIAEGYNETVKLSLALKGFLPEVTRISFASISLAKVSPLATTLTPKGVRKFSLT